MKSRRPPKKRNSSTQTRPKPRQRSRALLLSGAVTVGVMILGGVLLSVNSGGITSQVSFAITSPLANSTVSAPVDLAVALTGSQLGEPSAGRDHLHISIDGGRPLALYDRSEVGLPLPRGPHTVAVELAGPNHRPLLPPQFVSFVVQ